MFRSLTNFFQYLIELASAPFRLASGVWRQQSAYDDHGYFNYLKGREENPDAFTIEGVDPEIVDRALGVFCEAFDILPVQKYCLRPNDQITKIYCAMVTGCWDEQEMERLGQRLEAETGVPLKEEDVTQFDTLEDLVIWFSLNTREARAAREAEEAAAAKAEREAEEQEAAKAEEAQKVDHERQDQDSTPEASDAEGEKEKAGSNGEPKRSLEKRKAETSRGGEGLSF